VFRIQLILMNAVRMNNIAWMRNQLFLFPVHLHQMKTLFVVSIRKVQKLSLFWKPILFINLSLKK
jgi:hypothetical protein